MKKILILLIVSLFTATSYASFIKKSKVGVCEYNIKKWTLQSSCQSNENESCIRIPPEYMCQYHVLGSLFVNDYSRPGYYTKNQTDTCDDQSDCQTKLASLLCLDNLETSMINEDYSEYYCSKFTYHQTEIPNSIIVIDEAKKTAYETAESQRLQLENAMAAAQAKIHCSQNIVNIMSIRNASKDLNVEQMNSYLAIAQEVINALTTGALGTAKANIEAVTVDGIIITQEDKDASIAEVNKCLAL